MNGSRLGRGRGGRLALYVGIISIFVIIVYLYRAASFEMTRLHELHLQCAHQQESLAAQLQVIFEYKVRLEKSLQEEKNSNQALKQELQQRASREKSLRDKDKDNAEISQRLSAMQQDYKILQSENKDLQDDCSKRQKIALEETNRLQTTLKNLRSEIRKAQEDKKTSLESLKNKHAQLKVDYEHLEAEYNSIVKRADEDKSKILHLEKQVFQLTRELDPKRTVTTENKPAASQNQEEANQDKSRGHSANEQVARPVQQPQQVSRPNNADENPQPLPAPQDHQTNDETLNEKNDGILPNEQISDIAFEQKDGNIVPVGRNDLKDQQNMVLPLPYKEHDDNSKRGKKNSENVGEEPPNNKRVLKKPNEKSSSTGPKLSPIQPQRNDKNPDNQRQVESHQEIDELQDLNDKVLGIFNDDRL